MSEPGDSLKHRYLGSAVTGTVGIRDFDLGVVTTLGAVEQSDPRAGQIGTFIPDVKGVCAPDGMPGIPVVFAFPEDVLKDYKMPFIEVRRDDISPAMERWHPGGIQYKAWGAGAVPFVSNLTGTPKSGFDRTEQLPQATPFDITYTITVKARYRGAPGNRAALAPLFQHVLKTYPPYGKINVVDSIGDLRGYHAFNEGVTNLDSVGETQERELGYALTLRVEAELDLNDPITAKVVKVPLTRLTYRL